MYIFCKFIIFFSSEQENVLFVDAVTVCSEVFPNLLNHGIEKMKLEDSLSTNVGLI